MKRTIYVVGLLVCIMFISISCGESKSSELDSIKVAYLADFAGTSAAAIAQ